MPIYSFVPPDRKAQLGQVRKECAGHSKRVEKTREALLCALFFQEKTAIQSGRFMDELKQLMNEVTRRTGMLETIQTARRADTASGIPRIRLSDFVHKDIPDAKFTFVFEDDASAAKSAAGHFKRMLVSVNEIQTEMREAQKSADYLNENGFFWVAECAAPAIANCKKAASSLDSLGKFLRGIPPIPENPQPTQKTLNQFRKLGDFVGRLFDEPIKTRILSCCDFDDSNISEAAKSIGTFVFELLTRYPQLRDDDKFLSLCTPLEDTGSVLSIDYEPLVHFSVSYICDSISREKRRELLGEIATKNAHSPIFQKIPPLTEKIAKLAEPALMKTKKDPNCTKEAEFRKFFEVLGATEEEIKDLYKIKKTIFALEFCGMQEILGVYRENVSGCEPLHTIVSNIEKINALYLQTLQNLMPILLGQGIGKEAVREIVKRTMHNFDCGRLARMAPKGLIVHLRENSEEILLSVAETFPDVHKNINQLHSTLAKMRVDGIEENNSHPKREFLLPESVKIELDEKGVNAIYITVILTGFRARGSTFNGKAHLPPDFLKRNVTKRLVKKMGTFSPSEYEKAMNFLLKCGIVQIYQTDSLHLITSGHSVQNETAQALIPPLRVYCSKVFP